jgi:hypothetical protein
MDDLFIAVKLAWRKLSTYYTDVTPTIGKFPISAHILDLGRMLWSCWKSDKGMHINSKDETSYIIQYQEALLMCVENEYCAKQRHVSVNSLESLSSRNFIPSVMPPG